MAVGWLIDELASKWPGDNTADGRRCVGDVAVGWPDEESGNNTADGLRCVGDVTDQRLDEVSADRWPGDNRANRAGIRLDAGR